MDFKQVEAAIGAIVMTEKIGDGLKSFRKSHSVKAIELAREMKVSAGVICDYERGRRPSPGCKWLKDYVLGVFTVSERNQQQIQQA